MPDYSFAQLPTTTPMNRRPLIITEPGDYRTRDGRRVTIHEIKLCSPTPPYQRHEVTAFEAKGSVWRVVRGVNQPRDYDIWHLSGHHVALGDDPLDIVGRWE
jgi:hypothetical protein